MFLELFLFAKNMFFFTKTISYGAEKSKFLKSEIGWISDFGRTSAPQQKNSYATLETKNGLISFI